MRLSILVFSLLLAACAQPEISQERVERVISTLASDDMRGRAAFSPDADRAADFIAGEFEDIGLETFGGAEGYLQRFPVYSTTARDVIVALNGAEQTDVAASLSADVNWAPDSGPEPVVVSAEDDLTGAWRTARNTGDALLLVHPAHAETFGRIAGFLGRPTRSLESGGRGNSLVMVLTDQTIRSGYSVTGTAATEELELANVVGVIPGRRPDEVVLFSAHYDHIGIRPGDSADADSIANGANDNASGTTAVIELAHYFEAMPRQERTMVFVAFTAEEVGGYGSRHFSSQMNPDEIVAMLNIEMIGKGAVEGPNTAWITGFDRSDFGAILQSAVEGTEFSFYADPYPNQNLFYRSDNATLARLGVPAHTLSTTPIDVDPDYHQVSDHVETLDIPHLTATIRAIAAGATTIISGEATPARIDPQTVN
ncbi:MAG: M20/M25/M40 family metallo-hydrolase [Rhodothermales bacterium]|nr:M20/M25/M40 family metallo-hydrolase [Rhodothermales bacterium]